MNTKKAGVAAARKTGDTNNFEQSKKFNQVQLNNYFDIFHIG